MGLFPADMTVGSKSILRGKGHCQLLREGRERLDPRLDGSPIILAPTLGVLEWKRC